MVMPSVGMDMFPEQTQESRKAVCLSSSIYLQRLPPVMLREEISSPSGQCSMLSLFFAPFVNAMRNSSGYEHTQAWGLVLP